MTLMLRATRLESALSALLGGQVSLLLLEQPVEHGNFSWAVFRDELPIALVQTPVDERRSAVALDAARATLESVLSGPAAAALREIVPLPLSVIALDAPDEQNARRFHVWQWRDGWRFSLRDRNDLPLLLATAGDALSRLQTVQARRGGPTPLSPNALHELATHWTRSIGSGALERLARSAAAGLTPYLSQAGLGLIHGDFWWGNLLRDGNGPVLLDWEEIDLRGLTWIDPLLFTLTLLLDVSPGGSSDGPEASETLRWCSVHTGVPPAILPHGMVLAGLYKAMRERTKYDQRDTPVQRWLHACAAAAVNE